MQVADFLRDEYTAKKAANLANLRLRNCRPIPQSTRQWEKPCQSDVQCLQSLQPELAQKILREEGSFAYWQHVLPLDCHALALAASVSDTGQLTVRLGDGDRRRETVAAMQSLSGVLRELRVPTGGNRKDFSTSLKPLVHLRSLHVHAAGYPKLPRSLQALTRISIASCEPQRGASGEGEPVSLGCSDEEMACEGAESDRAQEAEASEDEQSDEEVEEDEESSEEGSATSGGSLRPLHQNQPSRAAV